MKIKADGVRYNPTSLAGIILNEEVKYFDAHKLPEQAPEIIYTVDFRDYDRLAYDRYKNAYVSIWCSFKGYENRYKWGISGHSIEPGHEQEELEKAKKQVAAWNADPENSPAYEKAQEIWSNWRKSTIDHYDYMAKNYNDIYRNGHYSGD